MQGCGCVRMHQAAGYEMDEQECMRDASDRQLFSDHVQVHVRDDRSDGIDLCALCALCRVSAQANVLQYEAKFVPVLEFHPWPSVALKMSNGNLLKVQTIHQ